MIHKLFKRYEYRNLSGLTVELANVGMMAHPGWDERSLIPFVTVETENFPELHDLIDYHSRERISGDVRTTWGFLKKKEKTILHVAFDKPIELQMFIPFDLKKQTALVDHIVNSAGFFLQSSQIARKPSEGATLPFIIVEVNAEFPEWPELFLKHVTRRYREKGMPKSDAEEAARRFRYEQARLRAGFRI